MAALVASLADTVEQLGASGIDGGDARAVMGQLDGPAAVRQLVAGLQNLTASLDHLVRLQVCRSEHVATNCTLVPALTEIQSQVIRVRSARAGLAALVGAARTGAAENGGGVTPGTSESARGSDSSDSSGDDDDEAAVGRPDPTHTELADKLSASLAATTASALDNLRRLLSTARKED